MRSLPSRRACTAAAVLAYLLVALFSMRSVAPDPTVRLPYPAALSKPSSLALDHFDQSMVVATVIRNAHLLTTRPWDLLGDFGQCFPMPRAYTLGEHMFGVGLLAAGPYALTGDPILSYNLALVLTLWLPAITMYFLALRFTRSAPAAFFAGLAFALGPGRLVDPSHPYVHGDLWGPAVLLFLHRLFVSARWRDALGLAFFFNLQVAESLYPLISTSLLASIYGGHLVFRYRDRLRAVLPPLLLAATLGLLGVWVVLGPYLDTRATWELLSGRLSMLLGADAFLPGREYFPGFLVTLLVAVALLDRLRGRREVEGEDPRLAFLVGGLLVAWCAMRPVEIPGTGILLRSPFLLLRGVVPGLEAVRAFSAVAIGLGTSTSLLAGYGLLALLERLPDRRGLAVLATAVCSLALLWLRFDPATSGWTFGQSLHLEGWEARPAAADIDLVRTTGNAPLVEYPLAGRTQGRKRLELARSLLLASYAPRPIAACYNSFQSAVNEQVIALTQRLPEPAATRALGALGFEVLFVKRNRTDPTQLQRFPDAARPERAFRRLDHLGDTADITAYAIRPVRAVRADWTQLAPAANPTEIEALMPRAQFEFSIHNRGRATFRHPEPVAPSDLVVQWRGSDGQVALQLERRALLPIALAGDDTLSLSLDLETPLDPGHYVVTVARAAEPDHVLARLPVHVPPLLDRLTPAEATLRLWKDFIYSRIYVEGMVPVGPEGSVIDVVLGPGIDADALRSFEQVDAHFLDIKGQPYSTPLALEVATSAKPGLVRAFIPAPEREGIHFVVLTPPGDPWTLLGGRIVQRQAEQAP